MRLDFRHERLDCPKPWLSETLSRAFWRLHRCWCFEMDAPQGDGAPFRNQ